MKSGNIEVSAKERSKIKDIHIGDKIYKGGDDREYFENLINGLTRSQIKVLKLVKRWTSLIEISKETGIHRSNVTRAIRPLVKGRTPILKEKTEDRKKLVAKKHTHCDWRKLSRWLKKQDV